MTLAAAVAPGAVLAQGATVTCSSKIGERVVCPANTSEGVALAKSAGEAACLLGKTWGYDDHGIWVSDGCSGTFVVGQQLSEVVEKAEKAKSLEYIPNLGFRLYEGGRST